MSDRMEQLIQEHRLIPPGSTVLCAVSGGADSVYLLHRLYCLRRELDFTLVAAHYDHRLVRNPHRTPNLWKNLSGCAVPPSGSTPRKVPARNCPG